MGLLKRSRLEVLLFIVVSLQLSNAQLDYRPGPPYPESNSHSHPGHRVKFGSKLPPLVTPDILRTLSKAFAGGVPVYPPGSSQNNYQSSSPSQIRYSSPQSYHQPQQYSAQSNNAQTAHVYFSHQVQKPMENVIVKFQQSPAGGSPSYNNYNYNHDVQPIQQYSQPDPVIHQSIQVVQYPNNNYQPGSEIRNSQTQTYSAPPAQQESYPQQMQNVIQPTPQPYTATAFRQESQPQKAKNKRPSLFSINVEYPHLEYPRPKKWRQQNKNRPIKKKPQGFEHPFKTYTYKTYTTKGKTSSKKPSHSEAFPVFTVIGRGLDGLNAVRRGVKKGGGKVVASGVKFGGKLAEMGAGVVAKAIKVASSI